jgi:hypothetical protein
MPKYDLTKTMYLNQPDPRSDSGFAPKRFRAGATKVSYDGWPGAGMIPLDAEAKRRVEIVEENRGTGVKLPATVADYDKAQAKTAKAEKSPAKAA